MRALRRQLGWLARHAAVALRRNAFLLSRHFGQRLRTLEPRFVGVRLHTANLVPVPPSRYFAGPQLVWVNKSDAIVEVPVWLLEPEKPSDENPLAAVPIIHPGTDLNELRYV